MSPQNPWTEFVREKLLEKEESHTSQNIKRDEGRDGNDVKEKVKFQVCPSSSFNLISCSSFISSGPQLHL